MKLATVNDRTRDGMLVVVSRDLTRCVSARPIAPTMQAALDDWAHVAPRLADLAHDLELGAVPAERFHEHAALCPLPRAFRRLIRSDDAAQDGSPPLRQAVSDGFSAPRAPLVLPAGVLAADFAAGTAVITDDLPAGADREAAAAAIRLVMLACDVTLHEVLPAADGGGSVALGTQAPGTFSPVAVTPDELGGVWDGARIRRPLLVAVRGKPFGRPDAGATAFDFAALVAAAARTRALSAGTIVGAGATADNGSDGGPARAIVDGGPGYASVAAARAAETALADAPATPWITAGDSVRIEMKDTAGHSIFGAVEQTVEHRPA